MITKYDFSRDHLVALGRDPTVIQTGIKRMIDRIVEGGERNSNWNIFQAKKIAYGGLVLEPDAHYDDGKGHEYYIDIVLNADLPNQLGLMKVVERGYDPVTALWPEAPGYGFNTTSNIVEVASLLSDDPRGRELLAHPLLERAMLAQLELPHPNGLSVGLGDTTNVRINTRALELLVAAARSQGRADAEERLTAVLRREARAKRHTRSRQVSITALTRFVPELRRGSAASEVPSRSYYGRPATVRDLPMPTLLVRRSGEAWQRPFIAVYEPFFLESGATIRSVRPTHAETTPPGLATAVVDGTSCRILLMESDDDQAAATVEGVEFAGTKSK